jgi:hypothetical protein
MFIYKYKISKAYKVNPRTGNILISAVTLLALVILFVKFESFVTVSYREIHTTDYPNYYFAGKRWLNSELIYNSIKDDVKKELGWGNYIAYPADPPLAVILLSPLSKLGIVDGAFLLNIISILLLIFSIFFLSKNLGYSVWHSVMFTSLALSSMPFLFLLKKFHMEAIILALGVAGFLKLKKRSYKSSGLIWGVAAALKIFPVLWIIPYFFNKPKKQVFIYGMGSFIFFSLLSFLLVGNENTISFFLEVIPKSKDWYGRLGNYSIVSFLTALMGFQAAKLPAIIACFLILVLFLNKIKLGSLSDERCFALSTSAALLLSPLSWLNYFILTFPVLIFLFAKQDFSKLKSSILFILVSLIFWSWPDFIAAPWIWLSLCLSFLPMFALFGTFTFLEKKL